MSAEITKFGQPFFEVISPNATKSTTCNRIIDFIEKNRTCSLKIKCRIARIKVDDVPFIKFDFVTGDQEM